MLFGETHIIFDRNELKSQIGKAAEPIQLPTPGVGEKIRKTPQRIIEQKLAPEATMREVTSAQ